MRRPRPEVLILLLYSTVLLALAGANYLGGYQFSPPSPAGELAETARSLWRTGSVVRSDYPTLLEEIRREAARSKALFYQDVFAEGASGALLPKHPFLVSLVAAPFYGAFGDFGLWLCNQLFILALALSLYRLAGTFTDPDTALLTILLAIPGTSILFRSYALSHDLFAATTVACGVGLARGRPLLGGFVLSLSLFVRTSNILYLPLLLFWWMEGPDRHGRREKADGLLGAFAGIALLMTLNNLFWGGPLTTAYHRLRLVAPSGALVPDDASHFIGVRVLVANLWTKLFSSSRGLLTNDPLVLLSPVGLLLSRGATRKRCALVFAVALLNIILIFSYSYWGATAKGNRFLLPAVALLVLPAAVMVRWGMTRLGRNEAG